MKILFLSRWFPYPTNNGSKLRIYNLLRGLSQHHDVTLLSFTDQPDVRPDAPEIRSLCTDIHLVPWKEFDRHSLRARFGFLSLKPRSVVDTFSKEMAQLITGMLKSQDYDLVIASQVQMAAYYPYFKNTPALFEEIELGLSYGESHYSPDLIKRLRHSLTWFKLRIYFSQLLGSFGAGTVTSEQEYQLLAKIFPAYRKKIEIIPNCVSVGDYENEREEPKPNQLIFSGSFRYHTNYEAMIWFIKNVYPRILEQIPDSHLVITGDHANLPLPSAPNVILAGYVDDIKALIASSSVSIAPLWSGGGTRLKILEAMALGTPVVATSKGAEGLEAQTGSHLFITDSPDGFADSVISILSDKDLRHRIAMNARQLVEEKYDWGKVMPRLLNLIERVSVI